MVELFNAELPRRDGFAAKFRRSTGRSYPPMKTFLVILLGLCGAIVLVVPASSSGETATALRMPEELDELLAPVAHPARWGDSGIMTFLVNQQGTVDQCNLGPDTAVMVAAMTGFNPDDAWTLVPPPGAQ